jgi:hypothetical protein
LGIKENSPQFKRTEGCDMEARAGVEPTYTDLQRINGHNLPYKTIGYRAINCRVTICATIF